MARMIAGYVTFLLVFGGLDAVWLTIMVPRLYLPTLGDSAAASVRMIPAIMFYLAYAVGAIAFVAGGAESVSQALLEGLFFGAIAYATYDLTNYATLRNWSLSLTVSDMAWSAVATSTACCASFLIMSNFSAA
jgi:uncharacterized membrane protein